MIGYIRGVITAILPDGCFVEAGGIGYRVFLSDRDRGALSLHEEARVITYMAVREDSLTLYGFLAQESYDLFVMLIGVSNIGPKVALGILSSVSPEQFYLAVKNKDLAKLTKLPGIGKKTAERLVLELKDKVGDVGEMSGEEAGIEAAGEGIEAEAIGALCSLGYKPEEVHAVVHRLAASYGNPAELIGAALRELGKTRI